MVRSGAQQFSSRRAWMRRCPKVIGCERRQCDVWELVSTSTKTDLTTRPRSIEYQITRIDIVTALAHAEIRLLGTADDLYRIGHCGAQNASTRRSQVRYRALPTRTIKMVIRSYSGRCPRMESSPETEGAYFKRINVKACVWLTDERSKFFQCLGLFFSCGGVVMDDVLYGFSSI